MEYRDGRFGAKKRAGVWLGFYIHLAAYIAVNALLVAINLVRSPDRLWFGWPLFGWGIGVVAHAIVTIAVTRDRASGAG